MSEGGGELIVTEKDNAARRIADILSDGSAVVDEEGEVNVYAWRADGRDRRVVGLSGHVVGVDFPPEYEDWRAVEPVELIDAPIEKRPTREDIVSTLQDLAADADRAVIATDYDREGELIGKEAYELVREVTDAPVSRVRFSSITDREVRRAFQNPDEIDFQLAAAGEARQEIDLVWGAALTRFLSLSAGRLGEDFVSVGRVQSPTLRLIVDREREIREFVPEDYWEVFADLLAGGAGDDGGADGDGTAGDAGPAAADGERGGDGADGGRFEAQYFYLEDGTETERIDDEGRAESVHGALAGSPTATVEEVRRRTRTDDPPAPFDTTRFIKAAGSLGFGASEAMDVAEELYTAGYVTYPRTDNTVYPEDLDPAELLESLSAHPEFGEDAASLLDGDVEPTAGDTETTDHPPIHPTGELPGGELDDDERQVYELVVRHFLATVADPAEWAHLRVTAAAGDHRLKANGKRLLERGYHAVYPYRSTAENHVPAVSEGDELAVADVRLEAKQTQPPRRYGQSRLIEKMEEIGVGTKATRHRTIEKLYDRGYVDGDPPRPTALAMAVVEAAEEYAEHVVSEGMTRQLEADMTAIAEGEATLEEVTAESREMLETVFEELTDSREEIADRLRASMKADRTLGPCPESDHRLLVREARSGSYFVGCDGYPDCEYTLPLPETGRPYLMDRECEDHGLAHVKMLAGRKTFVHGCPLCKAEEAGEGPTLGPCPDCGDGEGGELAVKRLRSGSRLVGCTRYPDCEYSLPLPRRGDLTVTDGRCETHGLPEVRIVEDDGDPWELGCPVCNYREYRARQAGDGDLDLQALDGVGERTAEKFEDAGVPDLRALAAADPEDLADRVHGVSADRIREWQDWVEGSGLLDGDDDRDDDEPATDAGDGTGEADATGGGADADADGVGADAADGTDEAGAEAGADD